MWYQRHGRVVSAGVACWVHGVVCVGCAHIGMGGRRSCLSALLDPPALVCEMPALPLSFVKWVTAAGALKVRSPWAGCWVGCWLAHGLLLGVPTQAPF